ncbi:Ku protein [Legionella maioricensis]|uniref:Non-homologous end joining protein Ku n=1 Tax=Legionella maioricensis TaxID=2896528 RepID=A0A9X2CZP0_9GAMM|nr:Ku protein [Legionella maioricensis]MCL9683639.1 Ku protein [Legionella maioricensis]MCL9687661.1 Ku protein [Legionella maioricensis]
MPRPLWKGFISFGLVAIPVTIVSVEQKNELHFHLLDSKDKSRIRYQRINSETGKEVPWSEIVKGYEFDNDNYVVLTEEDFKKASPDAFKTIDIEEFVDFKDIDPLYFDKPYYLVPDSKNKKAYVLLREALKKTKKVGVAKVIIRTKEYLSLILPHNHALIINLIRFQQEIRSEKELDLPTESLKSYKIVDREIEMAEDLIKAMSHPWKPEQYHDEYREALMNWIESKYKSNTKTQTKKTASRRQKNDDVIDFMSLLKNSLKNKKVSKPVKKSKTS